MVVEVPGGLILRVLGGSYREISARLAHSPLYRWFCRCEDFALIRVPGKSTLNDYARWLPAAEMEEVLDTLSRFPDSRCLLLG